MSPNWESVKTVITVLIYTREKNSFSPLAILQDNVSKVGFWATVCKMVRPMLSVRCLSCPVCDVHALWPNGWTDQDETWHAGRPRPWSHCVRYGVMDPAPPPPKWHSPQFSAHICRGQMAAWIKMSLGMEPGLAKATLC